MALKSSKEILRRIDHANKRYGPLRSSHEGLGVALEEWNELQDAVKSNVPSDIAWECLDLAAVLIRMAEQITTNKETQNRSTK